MMLSTAEICYYSYLGTVCLELGLVVCDSHVSYKITHTVAVAPLVVVPGHQLQQQNKAGVRPVQREQFAPIELPGCIPNNNVH
jgi:hypothetical protein